MNASPDRAAMMAAEEAALLARLKRAVADVMDSGGEEPAVYLVAKRRNVPETRLRDALLAAGWQSRVKNPPGPRRRTGGNGKRHGT